MPKSKGRGGKAVRHKRKPLRDPMVAANMSLIRERGVNSPAARKAREEAYAKRPWTDYDKVKIIDEVLGMTGSTKLSDIPQ